MSLSKTIQALGDPTRREILEMLKKEDLTAGQIGENFQISAPSLSHHLNILKNVGLISSEKRGQERVYSLNLSVFEETAKLLIGFFKQK